MFKNIRNLVVGLLSAATLVAVPVAMPALVSANEIQDCLSQGTGLDATGAGGTCTPADTGGATTNINNIIKTIINVFSIVVGVVAVIMIIVGGFRYITSGGDSNNVSGAKNTIIYAIIGLVVVALAQFIVQFVLNKVTTQ
jgi:hypothetical protein